MTQGLRHVADAVDAAWQITRHLGCHIDKWHVIT